MSRHYSVAKIQDGWRAGGIPQSLFSFIFFSFSYEINKVLVPEDFFFLTTFGIHRGNRCSPAAVVSLILPPGDRILPLFCFLFLLLLHLLHLLPFSSIFSVSCSIKSLERSLFGLISASTTGFLSFFVFFCLFLSFFFLLILLYFLRVFCATKAHEKIYIILV